MALTKTVNTNVIDNQTDGTVVVSSNVVNGSNDLLIAFVLMDSNSGGDCTGVVFNASGGDESFTELIEAYGSGSGFVQRSQCHELYNPSVETQSVTATLTGYTATFHLVVHVIDNPADEPVSGDCSSQHGTSSTGSDLTATSVSGDTVIDGCYYDKTAGFAAGAGQTEDYAGVSNGDAGGSSYEDATGSTTSMAWMWNSNDQYGHVSVTITPEAGAGISIPVVINHLRQQGIS